MKGIGKELAEELEKEGIHSIYDLINTDAEELASGISGISEKQVLEMQEHAKTLCNT